MAESDPMPTLQDGLTARQPPLKSVKALFDRVGFDDPRLALSEVVRYALNAVEQRQYSQTITTPDPESLGGRAELTIRGDGTYSFRLEMRNTGFPDYSFSVVIRLDAANSALTGRKSGMVEGKWSSGPSYFNETENSYSPMLKRQWEYFRDGAAFQAHKEYKKEGILGDLQWLGEVFVRYLVVNAIAGGTVAAILVIGNELIEDPPVSLTPAQFAGIIAAGGVLWLLGPTMLIPALAVGAAVGTYSFQSRNLTQPEINVARAVFGETLDAHFGRIYITDLHHFPPGSTPNRAMTTPLPSGSIMICIGDNFTKPYDQWGNKSTFVHELVHVWQAIYTPRSPELLFELIQNEFISEDQSRYVYTLGDRWDSMNLEAQAKAVATWYGDHIEYDKPDNPQGLNGLTTPAAYADSNFRYVAENIRTALG